MKALGLVMMKMIVQKEDICVANQRTVFQSHGCVMEKTIVVIGKTSQYQCVVSSNSGNS